MSLKISTALGIAALVSAISLSACTAPPKTATDTPATAAASGSAASTEAMSNTLKFVDAGTKAPAGKKVAYLAECAAANAYCQTRQKGAQETAAKMGVQLTVFDANFDPAAQLQQVQDAVQRGFDGYIFSPVADAPGCSDFHLLQASGKPVSTINSPMCGNPDYTPETAGFVGMQTTRFFTEHVETPSSPAPRPAMRSPSEASSDQTCSPDGKPRSRQRPRNTRTSRLSPTSQGTSIPPRLSRWSKTRSARTARSTS